MKTDARFRPDTWTSSLGFFTLLRATPAWLRLTRERRRALAADHLAPLLAGNPGLTMRYFDAEAFTSLCSDVMMTARKLLADGSSASAKLKSELWKV